jgi:hypothetical protein
MINRKRLEIILKQILKIRRESVHWIQPAQCTFQWTDPVKIKINPPPPLNPTFHRRRQIP